MKAIKIFILFFTTYTYGQVTSVEKLTEPLSKQETMEWIASKFEFNFYNKPFTYKGDEWSYKFISYTNGIITFRAHINWKSGYGPERKYYFYKVHLDKIQKVKFDAKTNYLYLSGTKMTEFKYQNEVSFYNFLELSKPVSSDETILPIFHEASPWLLKSLAEAFEKIKNWNSMGK